MSTKEKYILKGDCGEIYLINLNSNTQLLATFSGF